MLDVQIKPVPYTETLELLRHCSIATAFSVKSATIVPINPSRGISKLCYFADGTGAGYGGGWSLNEWRSQQKTVVMAD